MVATGDLWEKALSELRNQIDEANFDTWLKTTRFERLEQGTLHLNVPSAFNRSWLLRNFKEQISQVVQHLAQRPIEIDFHVARMADDTSEATLIVEEEVRAEPVELGETNLSPRYTFESFVVGESNRFAHAASRAVAEPQTEAWNPLLIWGGVGLGKTHLLHAIGHEFLAHCAHARVRYVNSERFMNAFVQAIQQNNIMKFRDTYRAVDLLLLDDVQFLFGKEGTQNEFFHTFNELYGKGKKIVLSSDRPPSEMANIEDRLRSRFGWGLIVDIQAPDLETRMAILHKKAQLENFELPDDVALFIAERIRTNIRNFEGVLTSLRHHCRTTKEAASVEAARRILSHFVVSEEPQRVTVEHIQSVTCDYFNVTLPELVGKERHRKLTTPRHVAMYLCRLLTELSLPEIARYFNGRNHTSVLHACRKVERNLLRDSNLQNLTNYLVKKINEKAQ